MSCRIATHDDHAQAGMAGPAVCAACAARGALAVEDLLSAWLGLCHAIGSDVGGVSDEPVSRAAMGSKPPIKPHVYDLTREIEAHVLTWEGLLRSAPARRLPESARNLARAWGAVTADVEAVVMIDTAIALRDRAWRMLKWNDLVHHMPLPCPSCDVKELHRPNGKDWQVCHACGLFLTAEDYALAVRLELEKHGCHR